MEKKEIITAEEFIPDSNYIFVDIYGHGDETCILKSDIPKIMVEFAKMHCKAQLKAILDKVKISDDKWDDVINAYPENLIK